MCVWNDKNKWKRGRAWPIFKITSHRIIRSGFVGSDLAVVEDGTARRWALGAHVVSFEEEFQLFLVEAFSLGSHSAQRYRFVAQIF